MSTSSRFYIHLDKRVRSIFPNKSPWRRAESEIIYTICAKYQVRQIALIYTRVYKNSTGYLQGRYYSHFQQIAIRYSMFIYAADR